MKDRPVKMPPRESRVASLYKRAVYKTEFDIFKRNTDIDLISLVSLDEDPDEEEFLSRRCVSGRATSRKQDYSDPTRNRPYDRCISARFQSSRAQNFQSTKRVVGWTCKSSAPSVHKKANCDIQIKGRSHTSSGFRRNETGDLSRLNKRDKINVDFKCGRSIPQARVTQSKQPSPTTRQVKSAYAARTRCVNIHVNLNKKDSSSNRQIRNTTTRSGPTLRAKSAVVSKVNKTGFITESGIEKATGENEYSVSTNVTQVSFQCDENEEHVSDAKDLSQDKTVAESDDSGVVKDLSVAFADTPQTWDYSPGKTGDQEILQDDGYIDIVSLSSVDVSSDEDDVDNVSNEKPENNNLFDFNCLVKDLVTRKQAERINCDPKYTKLDNDSSLSRSIEETLKRKVVEKGPEETTVPKTPQEMRDTCIKMSKEAKSVFMESLYDLRSKRNSSEKENIEQNVRFKSVNKQKRINENRNKYNYFMKERTETMLNLNIRTKEVKDIRTRVDSSKYSDNGYEDSYDSDFEETSDLADFEPQPQKQQKFLPSLTNSGKVSSHTGSSSASKHVMSLDQMKKRKYKIPGIGNYDLVSSPDVGFEITPPGFDCRYNSRPILTKEELDPPPQCIQERSIQKCKKWLKKVNLSPMSLNPVYNRR